MASLKEKAEQILAGEVKIPAEVEGRCRRGKARMSESAPKNNECLRFVRGRQYTWVDSEGALREQETTSSYEGRRGGKARHRVRSIRNYIYDHFEAEVAGATQRVPGYDVAPTSYEPKRVSAAKLARKAIYYGYEAWNLDKATERTIRLAVATGEGFAWPYFDNTIGPYSKVNGKVIGRGEIRCRVFGPNEVFWEPRIRFADSRWFGIVQAREIESVMAMEGFIGGKLEPDAQGAETSDPNSAQDRLVLVTDYLERPSKARPNGRWITMANGRVIVEERPYPCVNHEGQVLDEPVLHQLYYSEDSDSDRNLGPVEFAIDPQRQLNHAVSKIAEWVNLTLNPQLLVVNGKVLSGKMNDTPGAVVRVVGAGEASWRVVPPIPPELFKQKEEAITDIARMFAQNDIPSQVESGKGIQFLLEKDSARRATFYRNLARFHSSIARHCLYLMQRHYSEPRLLQIRGEDGTVEPIHDFLGANLLGEVDVRVSAGSIEPRTRESIEARILGYADRGWVSPHEAMQAINAGTAEGLVQSYERDVARANLIIQKVKEGPEVLFATPPRRPFYGEDPGWEVNELGETVPRQFIPGWMPRPVDNIIIQKDVIADFMKGTEYDDFEPPQQEALNAVFDSLLQLEAKKAAEEAQAQMMTAESMGAANAARPSTPPPTPDKAPLNATT